VSALLLKVKAHLKNVQVISWNAIKFGDSVVREDLT